MDTIDDLFNWLAAQGRSLEWGMGGKHVRIASADELRRVFAVVEIRISSATLDAAVHEEGTLQDTTKARRPAGRKPRKFKQVLAQMRAEITAGKITAAQLQHWRREELEKRYGAQHLTIEKALAELLD
jgi:hypothetical protein